MKGEAPRGQDLDVIRSRLLRLFETIEQSRLTQKDVAMTDDVTEPGSALIEIEPGLALVYGDAELPGVEMVPFQFLDSTTRRNLSVMAARGVGGANVAAQGVQAAQEFGGIIRLAPETLKALKAADPIMKEGWNLGTLMTDGKFSHQVRWLPAEAANSAEALAGGPGYCIGGHPATARGDRLTH